MRAALVGLKGVKDAEVSFRKRQAIVQFEEKGDVSLNDLIKAVGERGFACSAT